MRASGKQTWGVLICFALATILPRSGNAAPPVTPNARVQHVVVDAELGPRKLLTGQVLDLNGRPRVGASVRLTHAGTSAFQTKTDEHGRFQFAEVHPGLLKVSTDDAELAVRCWANGTAPPHAPKQILLSGNQEILRGQRPIADFLAGPVLIGLIIAAAVAIPIAIHNSKDSAS